MQRNAARYEELQGATHRSTHTYVEYFEKRRKQIFRLKVKNIFEFDGRGRGWGGRGRGAGELLLRTSVITSFSEGILIILIRWNENEGEAVILLI